MLLKGKMPISPLLYAQRVRDNAGRVYRGTTQRLYSVSTSYWDMRLHVGFTPDTFWGNENLPCLVRDGIAFATKDS